MTDKQNKMFGIKTDHPSCPICLGKKKVPTLDEPPKMEICEACKGVGSMTIQEFMKFLGL